MFIFVILTVFVTFFDLRLSFMSVCGMILCFVVVEITVNMFTSPDNAQNEEIF